ncbi:MAG: ATP-binding protein, partial [Candidatus Aminicenantes bacterium]|nr:ATP-binding protein [Candidatus Aminicenantes bacterium]
SRVKINLDIPTDLWEINCDEDQIYQVFISLLDNAAEAMEGEGQVTIEAENLEVEAADAALKPGKYVKIAVKDEGEGIPGKNLHKIFDPYFSTRGRVSQKGLGFGLAIVYSIIKQHAGHIEVESKVNIGTAVTFYLPID